MDRRLFLRMAKDYVETLARYDSDIRWDEETWSEAAFRARFIMEDRTAQGFVITEVVPFAVFPDALYIAEFYVVLEARRRGIGLEAARELTKQWGKDIFLYILNRNTKAKLFWTFVESELDWKPIKRPEIRDENGCEKRVYQTTKRW